MRFSLPSMAALGLAGTAAAQGLRSSAYTDPKTGIDFQRYQKGDYSLGIAVPETLGKDLIAQMVFPRANKEGWGGVSLRGGMLNGLLFVVWADGENMVSSFRLAGSYANPSVYTETEVKATPIPDGTFVNSTHISYTFLCEGCVLEKQTSLTGESPVVGYAWSETNPADPSDPASALTMHDAGFGQFGLDIANAKSAKFAQWAALAQAPTPVPGTGPGNGTRPGVPGNSTVTPPTTSNVTYDVIVVGGGPAGIIAAERLAETGVSVLLIERGPANTVALGNTAQGLPWNDTLTPFDIPALGSSMTTLAGSVFCSDTASTAGCLLGGSSSINGLNFIHTPEHDWQRWPKGWSWADVSKAADRLYERNPGNTSPSEDGKYYDDLTYRVLSGYLSAKGWKEVDSVEQPNEKHMIYSRPSWSIKNNLRAGPARTYIPFAQDLPNFTLKLETKVIQPIRSGSTITGVLTQAADGSKQIIKVKQGGKVVLAAGAMSTPRLLWNAGIGKSDALAIVKEGASRTGVTLPAASDYIDLPVGHHLQDHAQVMLQFRSKTNFTAYNFNGIATAPVEADLDLYYQGSGPITQAAQRMHLWTSAKGADGRVRYLQGTASAMADGIITIRSFLTHGTTTVGELGISAAGNTILNTKPWLIDQEDRKAMADFVQYWLDLTSGSNSTLSYITPGATVEDIISSKMISGDHWVGSAKMGVDDGRSGNGSSVVDLNTKVYGTDNLFVVDASIHPDLPTGNTQSIIMITAEHAAEKIAALKVGGSSNSTAPAPAPAPVPTPVKSTKCKRGLGRRAPRVPMDFRRRSLLDQLSLQSILRNEPELPTTQVSSIVITVSSLPSEMDHDKSTRLGYKKSRNGCTRCKKRRVKCDEQVPCTACIRHRVSCSLEVPESDQRHSSASRSLQPPNDSSSANSPSSLLSASLFSSPLEEPDCWVANAELMLHYTTVAYRTLAFADNTTTTFQQDVPREALSHPYFLRQILAFSGFHLAYLHPDKRQAYLLQASKHQNLAIRGIREALSESVNSSNCNALWFTTTLIVLNKFAAFPSCENFRHHGCSLPVQSLVEIFSLVNGMDAVLSSPGAGGISTGPLKELFTETTHSHSYSDLLHGLCDKLHGLTRRISSDVVEAQTRAVLTCAAESITNCTESARFLLYKAAPPELRILFWWPMTVSREFWDLAIAGQPLALVLLAYYATLLHWGESRYWFFENWADTLVMAIVEKVQGSPWEDLVSWPVEVILHDKR
ncbi:hypothetical protein F66182_9555 [Fusarium sp. NRRL 66182]|nr:hypothetical protein F66182_9555 [Fusarium sp. NRRL 66182]